jgi:hypothetical protein
MSADADDDWSRYQKLVLAQLDTLHDDLSQARNEIASMHREIDMLKVKSGLWGFAAGAIPTALALIIHYLTKKE